MISILVVDDYAAVRSGIKALLADNADLKIVDEAVDFDSALRSCGSSHPDVVITDIVLSREEGDRTGLDLASEISLKYPDIKVIVLTAYQRTDFKKKALAVGAKGFLTQAYLTKQRLTEAVRLVAEGGVVMDKSIGFPAEREEDSRWSTLTDREKAILDLVSQGLSNKKIAGKLSISPKTAGNHIYNAYYKLGINSRVEAVNLIRSRMPK